MKRASLVIIVLTLGACATWWAGEVRHGDSIKVPHSRHKAAKVDCLQCHETVYDAKDLSERHLPPESTCMQCHKDEKAAGKCSMCHTDVKKAGPWAKPVPNIRLSHTEHLVRVKDDCTVCHKVLPDPVRTKQTVPPMSACLSCHEHKKEYDEGRCNGCHADLRKLGEQPLSTFSHAGDFVRQHGRAARASAAACAECHEQTFCADCHEKTVGLRVEIKFPEKVLSNFIHRNDFVSQHTVEAKADPAGCRRCHGNSFCDDCHRAQNLTPAGANPRNPHPRGWAFPGSAQFHGNEARRDISSCAACHDQGARSNCVDCHKSGGIGGNPHPPGWSDRHGRGEISSNGMCLTCHL